MKVAVVYGGTSPERDVSLRSGANVIDSLQSTYDVISVDVTMPIESYRAQFQQADVVFPIIHGAGGEDGVLQKMLEDMHIPYVGSGSNASKLCFDKSACKNVLRNHSLPTPKGELVTYSEFTRHPLRNGPFVLKPNTGGSSIDTIIAHDYKNISLESVKPLFDTYSQLLLEELISGVEVTVGVLHSSALPVIEIIPPTGAEFDYENKYNGQTQELCPPKHVAKSLQKKAQSLALAAHIAAGCQDFSRTDIMIDSKNNLYILEINTLPGMTSQSLFPKAALTAGISMQDLCSKLVELAAHR